MRYSFLILTTILFSCATTIDVPLNRFESPEAQKHMKVKFDGGYQKQASAVLTEDYTYNAPNTTNPRLTTDDEITASASLGIYDTFEVSIRVPAEILLKYQILGLKRGEAKKGNFSLAATISSAATGQNKTGTQWFSSTPYKIDLTQRYTNLGIILGYRAADEFLIYGGYNHLTCNFDGTYTQGTNPTAISGDMVLDSAHLGLEIGQPFSLKVEGAVGRLQYKNSVSETLFGLGATIGYYQ